MGTSVFHVPALVTILLSSTTTCAMRLNEEHSLSIPTSSSHSISALCSDPTAAINPAFAKLCSIFLSEAPSAKTSNDQSEDNTTKHCTALDPPTLVNASVSHSSTSNPPSKLRQEQKFQEILNKGMDQLQFEKYSKTAIFMLGNTGSGKTTLTQTLNGNLSQLHAVLTHSGRLIIIDDQDRIGLPTTTSKTIVPEYVVNPEHNISFFDCPGFDDNRGAETDIAAMYFLKSITDHVNRAKFLFTVTHSSVTIGNDRLDFDLLASHAARFMSNISKFNNSIGLIVTKVNSFSAWGSYLSDEMLLNGFIEFLQKFNSTLHGKLQDDGLGKNERVSLRRKVKFVEAILQQDDNGNFSKIWFLRNPPKCGPYSEMPYMSQVRERIADLYMNKLSYARAHPDDFGFTLKDKTLLKIQEVIVPEIVAEVENTTEQIITIMKREIFEDFEQKFSNPLEMKEALVKFNNIYLNLHHFVSTQTENHSILENVQRLFDTLHYDLQQSYLNQTSKQQKWLDFFDKVSMTTLLKPSTKWVFSNTLEDFRQIQERILKLIRDERVPLLISEIENESDSVIISVMSEYYQQNSHTKVQKPWKSSMLKLMDDYKKMKRFVANNLKQQEGGDKAEHQSCVSRALTSLASLMGYDLPGSVIDRIVEKEELLTFYINIIGNDSSVPKPSIHNSVLKLYEKIRHIRESTRKEIYEVLLPHTSSEIEEELSTLVESLCTQYSTYFEKALTANEVKAIGELNEDFKRVNSLSANSQSRSMPTIAVAVNQMYFVLGFTPVAENMTQHLIQLENDLNSYEEILEVTVNKPSIESAYSKIQYYIGGIREKTWQSIKHKPVPHTFKQIKEIVTYLLDVVQDVYLNNFYDGLNRNTMSSKLSIVKGHYGILVGLKNKWHNTSVEGNYSVATEIGEIYTILGYSMQSEQMIELERFEKMLDFYGDVTETSIERPIGEWTTDFNELVNRLGYVCDWYEFLVKINTHLQLYTTQIALNTVRESSIIWSAVAGLEILERFKIVHVSTHIKDIAQSKVNEMDKLQMSEILKNTFQPTIIYCLSNGRKALITGNYVKFTDFMKTPTILPCDSNLLQEVEIYASEVVYFDSDILASGRNLTLRVLGERWEVIGTYRKIALNGLDGSPPYSRAQSGQNYGDDGRAGVPGKPGGNGGRFSGIVFSVMNGNNLTLDVSAGNGGNGQDGGHGHSGRKGDDMTFDKYPNPDSHFDNLKKQLITEIKEHGDVNFTPSVYFNQNSQIAGEPGGSGGNGGHGGIAGEPGYPGLVTIIQANDTKKSSLKPNEITMVKKPGTKGISGEGGNGAKGGKYGDGYSCVLRDFMLGPWWDSCKSLPKFQWAPNGRNGEAGGNSIGQVKPTFPVNNNLQWETITGFKKFILESGSINGRKFLDTIDASPTISAAYLSAYSFTEELLNLEILFVKNALSRETYIKEYELLLGRIENFVRNNTNVSLPHKKVLNTLYVTALSKLMALREQETSSTMVVNVSDYFKAINGRIRRLKDAKAHYVASEQSKEFQTRLNSKIHEAQSFITTVGLPAIQELEVVLDEKTDKAIAELNALHKSTMQTKRVIQPRDFEISLRNQKILQGLSLIATVATFFGPAMGSVVGTAVNLMSSFKSFMALSNVPQIDSTLDLPAAIHVLMKDYQDKFMTEKSETISTVIQVAQQIISEHSNMLEGLSTQLSNLEEAFGRLQNISTSQYNKAPINPEMIFTTHQNFDKSFEQLLDAAAQLKNKLAGNDEGAEVVSKLGYLVNFLTVASTSHNFIKGNFHEQFFSTHKPSGMSETEELIRNIEKRKQDIYHSFIPIVKSTMATLFQNADNMPASSSVSLEVHKWRVKSMLKDVKMYLKGFVKGLAVEEEITLCVDKLDEAITMLIEIYEHIEKYEESKQLADYIANVNSPFASRVQINEPKLQEMFTKVNFFVKTNIFHYHYERAINAFKQWVFPYADKYLAKDRIISEKMEKLVEESDLEGVAEAFVEKIDELATHLDEYKAMVLSGDEVLVKSYFTSRSVSSRPFYVWENEQWQQSIHGLLSGQPIQLHADIWRGDSRRGAIKFKTIELHLSTTDEGIQKKLDQSLKHYHVIMTHSGVSYYRLLSDVFIMEGNNQTIRYSFEKMDDYNTLGSNDKVAKNVVHDKYKNVGDYLLSPYTYWTFQLIDMREGTENFDDLLTFLPHVSMELHGDGIYIDENLADWNKLRTMNVNAYYRNAMDANPESTDISYLILLEELKNKRMKKL